MNIDQILKEYDSMFGTNSLEEIEEYLVLQIKRAAEQEELGNVVTLLNEIIGFCRDTTQKEKALKYCAELKKVLEILQLEGSIEYATSLLNITNAYRAFGLFEESLDTYKEVLKIYSDKLSVNDFRFASLYNNWSLLYQEMGDFVNAKKMLLRALRIAETYEEAIMEQATTKTNLAATLLQIGTEEAYEEAVSYLKEALQVFEEDGGRDFHYGAALVTMGDADSYVKDYSNAAKNYAAGLREIEKHVGKTDNYARVLEKYYYVKSMLDEKDNWTSNLERSRAFYEKYGKEMIHTHFPEYEQRIAVGLVGEGSDCYGFDDEISEDHDYEIGFCMWLAEKDYKKIGNSLQVEYEKMIDGYFINHSLESSNNRFLQHRRGVFTVNEFYNRLLGVNCDFEKKFLIDYEEVEEFALAACTNGKVFRDDLGQFLAIRERLLQYYPEEIWRRKLAQGMHDFSQYAQSNYARMMVRKDIVTSNICKMKAVETTMDLLYLLQRKYAPYYKWKKKGLEKDLFSQRVLGIIEKIVELPIQVQAWENVKYSSNSINTADECVRLFEEVAELLLEEMEKQGLVKGKDAFLESYIGQILKRRNMDIVEKIVELEWKQFDKVKNEGGRADCQDNWGTFSIMRKSQYLAWPEELLESFYNDLLVAESKGWNLIMEKYARMMKSTTPEKYAEFEKDLPEISEERMSIQEEIIKIQVAWMEEFAKEYPKMAGNARSIRTSEDTAYNTSYETYLRGEISTYSENTFILYGRFITELMKESRNLAYEIMENTAKLYGYGSVDDAENRIYEM